MNPCPDDAGMDAEYPSEEWLESLANANDVSQLPTWMARTFPQIVAQIGYGHVDSFDGFDDFGAPITVIRYSTGGWSGQEGLITAIQRNMAWMLYAHSWHRGGHYEFRIPKAAEIVRNITIGEKPTP